MLSETNNSTPVEHIASLLSASPDEWGTVKAYYLAGDYSEKVAELAALGQFEASVHGLSKATKRELLITAVNRERAELHSRIDARTIQQIEGPSGIRLPNDKFLEEIGDLQKRLDQLTQYGDKIMLRVSNPLSPESVPVS